MYPLSTLPAVIHGIFFLILSPEKDQAQYLFIGIVGKNNTVTLASVSRETHRTTGYKNIVQKHWALYKCQNPDMCTGFRWAMSVSPNMLREIKSSIKVKLV